MQHAQVSCAAGRTLRATGRPTHPCRASDRAAPGSAYEEPIASAPATAHS
jgi:hypothetical protein